VKEKKFCPDCDEFIPVTKFYKDNHRADGHSDYCKGHHIARRKANKIVREFRMANGGPAHYTTPRPEKPATDCPAMNQPSAEELREQKLVAAGYWDRSVEARCKASFKYPSRTHNDLAVGDRV